MNTTWHNLGQDDYKVSYYKGDKRVCVNIEGSSAHTADAMADDMEYAVLLTPEEALALLQWLEGERAHIEHLVLQRKVDDVAPKEQGNAE